MKRKSEEMEKNLRKRGATRKWMMEEGCGEAGERGRSDKEGEKTKNGREDNGEE